MVTHRVDNDNAQVLTPFTRSSNRQLVPLPRAQSLEPTLVGLGAVQPGFVRVGVDVDDAAF